MGHEVTTVEDAGLKELKNGVLLRTALDSYDDLVTVDQNFPHQQNMSSFHLAIVVLAAKRDTYAALWPLMQQTLEAFRNIKTGKIVKIADARKCN